MSKREWMLQAALAALGQNRIDGMALSRGVGGVDRIVTVSHLSSMYDAICAETPQEGAWVEHDGDVSKAPEAGRMVEVMFRDRTLYSDVDPGGISWDHLGEPEDVVRWRYV